jgi:hypothetical protein
VGDGNVGGAAQAPPCPLCAGTGQRRIRRPGDPKGYLRLVNCRCAMTKDTDDERHTRWLDFEDR